MAYIPFEEFKKGNMKIVDCLKEMLKNDNRYQIDRVLNDRVYLSQEQVTEIMELLNGELRTSDKRSYIINGLARHFQRAEESYRKNLLIWIMPHTAVLSTMLCQCSMRPEDLTMIWEEGIGKKLLRRSQRKLRDHINMLNHFSDKVEAQDLEFVTWQTLEQMKPNLVCLVLNDHGDKLSASQKERLEAAALALQMMGKPISKDARGKWEFNEWMYR